MLASIPKSGVSFETSLKSKSKSVGGLYTGSFHLPLLQKLNENTLTLSSNSNQIRLLLSSQDLPYLSDCLHLGLRVQSQDQLINEAKLPLGLAKC